MPKKIAVSDVLLTLIIFIAAVVRFWNYGNMPYMYDELSALLRAQATSFGELIQKAKLTDVHPVGVHVFVHYYTLLFGNSEMVLKFPFIISGIAAIYFSYKTAAMWFNNTVALMCAACLATLQFPIMYSQLERLYAPGMLFASVMVWCWTNFFLNSDSKNKINFLTGYVAASIMCMYTHYFCLLFAFIVGATGLLYLTKQNFKHYFVGGICIALLFLPQLPVFIHHFSLGGMAKDSWLATPGNDWLFIFIKYLFHYSTIVCGMMALLFVTGIFLRDKTKPLFYKFRVIALLWGLSLFLIVFPYSILKAPTLQFSTMTFSFPFLLMFIFSFYKDVSPILKTVLVSVILLVNTATLFAVRRHHVVFYKQPYQEMALASIKMIKNFGDQNVCIALSGTGSFMDYYFEKYKTRFNFLRADSLNAKQFRAFVNSQTATYFVTGNVQLEFIEVVKETYPYMVTKNEGFTYSVYCFAKQKPPTEKKEKIIIEQSTAAAAKLDSTQEYSAGFGFPLSTLIKSRHSIIHVSAKISSPYADINPVVVLEIHDGDSLLSWNGADYQNFLNHTNSSNNVYLSKLFSGFNLKAHPNAGVKIYVWNRDKKAMTVEELKVVSVESNRLIYSLYEPIE